MPFLLSLLHSWAQLAWMFWSIGHFLVFLPTFVGTIGAYAVSRTWDLSWGNRPSENLSSMEASKAFAEQQAIKNQQKNASRFVNWLVVTLNITLVLTITLLEWSPIPIVVLACLVFFWALVQMILSLIYLLKQLIVERWLCHYAFGRCCRHRRLVFADYLSAMGRVHKDQLADFCKHERFSPNLPDSVCCNEDVVDICSS